MRKSKADSLAVASEFREPEGDPDRSAIGHRATIAARPGIHPVCRSDDGDNRQQAEQIGLETCLFTTGTTNGLSRSQCRTRGPSDNASYDAKESYPIVDWTPIAETSARCAEVLGARMSWQRWEAFGLSAGLGGPKLVAHLSLHFAPIDISESTAGGRDWVDGRHRIARMMQAGDSRVAVLDFAAELPAIDG